MIKAVIFDFFGVICSDEYWHFVKQDRQAESVFRDYTDEVNLGRIGWQDFVKKIADATGKSVEAVNVMYTSERINPLVVGFINELHKKYKTALLTNAHYEYIDHILEDGKLKEIFDVVAISSRVGIIKPDPRIYQHTLTQLEVEPHEAVHIDDLERHVQAAEQLGMKTILYRDFQQMKHDLDLLLNHT